jgi:hypothetical protein
MFLNRPLYPYHYLEAVDLFITKSKYMNSPVQFIGKTYSSIQNKSLEMTAT